MEATGRQMVEEGLAAMWKYLSAADMTTYVFCEPHAPSPPLPQILLHHLSHNFNNSAENVLDFISTYFRQVLSFSTFFNFSLFLSIFGYLIPMSVHSFALLPIYLRHNLNICRLH